MARQEMKLSIRLAVKCLLMAALLLAVSENSTAQGACTCGLPDGYWVPSPPGIGPGVCPGPYCPPGTWSGYCDNSETSLVSHCDSGYTPRSSGIGCYIQPDRDGDTCIWGPDPSCICVPGGNPDIEICDNWIDDDQDGFIDCQDIKCDGQTCGLGPGSFCCNFACRESSLDCRSQGVGFSDPWFWGGCNDATNGCSSSGNALAWCDGCIFDNDWSNHFCDSNTPLECTSGQKKCVAGNVVETCISGCWTTDVDCDIYDAAIPEYTCSGQAILQKFKEYSCTGSGTCSSSDSWVMVTTCSGGESSRCVDGLSACQNLCTNNINDDNDLYTDRDDPDCCAECNSYSATSRFDSTGGGLCGGNFMTANSWAAGRQQYCCGDDPGESYVTKGIYGAGCCANSNACVSSSGFCMSGTEDCSTSSIDEDCDGACGYDKQGCPVAMMGDNNCPVGITSISVSKAAACTSENIVVSCTPTVFGVDSVEATIGGRDCTFTGWSGLAAQFQCTTSNSPTSEYARCYVNPSKSFVAGTDKTASITVTSGGSCCSQHSSSAACSGAAGCEWCASCQAINKYSGSPLDRCVASGTCTSTCVSGQCGATCDGSIGCPDQIQCSGLVQQVRLGGNVCQTGAGQSCNCDYSINPWIDQSCSAGKCGAPCSAGQSQSCTTLQGYSGSQTCQASCTWSECASVYSCGDGIKSNPEECDSGPANGCTGVIGEYCAACRLAPPPAELCNDGIDNDCDFKIDGLDGKLTAAAGDDSVCPEGSGSGANRGCGDGIDNDLDSQIDLDDSGCCDACTGFTAMGGYGVFDIAGGSVNAYGDSCSAVAMSANSWAPGRDKYCCGDDLDEHYVTKGIFGAGCCATTKSCVDSLGVCRIGRENDDTLCSNGLDDDCDGLIDLHDPDCYSALNGTVFDGDRTPEYVIEDAIIIAFPPGIAEKNSTSNYYGYYELGNLSRGTYKALARKAGYIEDVVTVTLGPGTTQQDFYLYTGENCNPDCTDQYNICNKACNGINGCSFIHDKCHGRPKGFKANYVENGIYYDITCCEGPISSYPAIQANISGSAKALYDYISPVKFGGRIFRMHILVWTHY